MQFYIISVVFPEIIQNYNPWRFIIKTSYLESLRIILGKLNPNRIRDERYRRAAWTSSTMIMSRVVTIATGIITIPLVSRYLGSELFGFWMILTNFVSFLIFADLGIGVGFQNQLIRCYATNNKKDPGSWVANALLLMLSIAIVIVLTALFIVPLISLDKCFVGSSSEVRYWMLYSIQSLLISFSIALPAMLLEYIGNAYQRAYWVHGLLAFGRIVSLIGVCVGCYLRVSLPVLICLFVATPHIICLMGFIILWVRVPWLRPCWRNLDIKRIKKLFHIGIGMLGVRITHALAMQGPALITAYFRGFAEAGIIAVIQKIIEIPGIVTQSILVSTQSAMAEAAHKRDWLWVKRNLSYLTKINFGVFVLTTIAVVSIGGRGLMLFLDSDVKAPSFILLLLYCMYFGLAKFRFPFGSFLTCIDRVYTQSFYRFIALLCVLLAILSYGQTSILIIVIFLFIGEIPQLACTVFESYLVIYNEKETG